MGNAVLKDCIVCFNITCIWVLTKGEAYKERPDLKEFFHFEKKLMAGKSLWIISSWAMKCGIHQYVKQDWNGECEVCSTEAVLWSAQKRIFVSQVLKIIRKTSIKSVGKSHSTSGVKWNYGINTGVSHWFRTGCTSVLCIPLSP